MADSRAKASLMVVPAHNSLQKHMSSPGKMLDLSGSKGPGAFTSNEGSLGQGGMPNLNTYRSTNGSAISETEIVHLGGAGDNLDNSLLDNSNMYAE